MIFCDLHMHLEIDLILHACVKAPLMTCTASMKILRKLEDNRFIVSNIIHVINKMSK